ncbi:autoinducer binding domain-containing protein [Thioclava sp. GXIMD4216]|uniref:autoinducer binding domain-containing protein n=1 Tax=Thioclava sp. GXIMD4216 TaxID=3131929 RepID=UPI0030D418C4
MRDSTSAAATKLTDTIEHNLAHLDFDYYAICAIGAQDFTAAKSLPTMHVTNYPEEWARHYASQQLYSYDPVLQFGRLVSYPVKWSDLKHASGYGDTHGHVQRQAQDFGLYSGICMSIHNLDGSLLLASLSKANPCALNDTLMNEAARALQSLNGVSASLKLAGKNDYDLTKREIECLSWAAIGKTSSDISAILHISNNTVDCHFKSAMRKLAANSRTFAIIKAMRSGILSI